MDYLPITFDKYLGCEIIDAGTWMQSGDNVHASMACSFHRRFMHRGSRGLAGTNKREDLTSRDRKIEVAPRSVTAVFVTVQCRRF